MNSFPRWREHLARVFTKQKPLYKRIEALLLQNILLLLNI